MRLLQTDCSDGEIPSLTFEEFEGNKIPPYAIVSHVWEDEEVLFSHIRNNTAHHRKGYTKVINAIVRAHAAGLGYLWIDTCCIDKSSSAELSEAINSMYQWYEAATVCYAYLSDVCSTSAWPDIISGPANSKWFTRGWCLQELIAPRDIIFFSKDWVTIGQKEQLLDALAEITGIDIEVLKTSRPVETVSVAKRLSWAAHRQTTRPEDIAYCLMGIFSVNMPLLYGEGSKAFQRLQEEIMKSSSDHSLFTWTRPGLFGEHGLLADSPADFASAGSNVAYTDWEDRPPYAMTNRGLHISLHMVDLGSYKLAVLNCPVPSLWYTGFMAIYLQKITGTDQQYTRVRLDRTTALYERGNRMETIFVPQNYKPFRPYAVEDVMYPRPTRFIELWKLQVQPGSYDILETYMEPIEPTHQKYIPMINFGIGHFQGLYTRYCSLPSGHRRLACAILFRRKVDNSTFTLLLGTIDNFDLGVCTYDDHGTLNHLEGLPKLQEKFRPMSLQEVAHLSFVDVSITYESSIRNGGMIYSVTIDIRERGILD